MYSVQLETLLDQLLGGVFLQPSGASDHETPAPPDEVRPSPLPLPDLKIRYIFGTNSPWTSQWCSWQLEAERERYAKSSQRPLELLRVEGGNHFVRFEIGFRPRCTEILFQLHWDDPDKFLAVLAEKPGVYIAF